MIGQRDEFHLVYLFINDIKEEKISGLAHVAEHAMLFPLYKTARFARMGYTCNTHVCLHFCSNSLEVLQELDKRIICGCSITDDNIECAKSQVAHEIISLFADTEKKKELVKFVTDSRVCKFAMGDIAEITKINTSDVQKWFAEKLCHNNICRFLFRRTDRKMLSEPIYSEIGWKKGVNEDSYSEGDKYYCYGKNEGSASFIDMYFKVPVLNQKLDFIKKALFEYCVKNRIFDTLKINLRISDKFFDYDERYLLISMPWYESNNVEKVIYDIREIVSKITWSEFEGYKQDFEEVLRLFYAKGESSYDYVNARKNSILYDLPMINEQDLQLIEQIDFSSFPTERIVKQTLRVVIR